MTSEDFLAGYIEKKLIKPENIGFDQTEKESPLFLLMEFSKR